MSALSSNDLVYLRPEVKLEPLVYKFYAWSHLIAPAQLAMNVTFRILPQLRSFVDNPGVHLSANKDPKMYGGPFTDLKAEDIPQVQRLIADIEADGTRLVELATALRDLDRELQEKATGYSLGTFYDELPPTLRGLVECLYDQSNHPRLRLFETLLYESGLAPKAQQVMLSCIPEGGRPFFMSTPRLPSRRAITLDLAFNDGRVDDLSAMRTHPRPFAEIASLLEVPAVALDDFKALFTPAAPRVQGTTQFKGDGVRVRYFGHACVLVQTAKVSVLIDPTFAMEQHDDGRLTIADLPPFVDILFITHAHHDHFCPEMLLQLRHRVGKVIVPNSNFGSIVDPSMKLVLRELGFRHVVGLDPFEHVDAPGGSVMSLPFMGEHADLDIFTKQAALVQLEGRKLAFLVDSDGRDSALYERTLRRIGPVDAFFIGMECHGAPLNWLYEPLLTKAPNRRNNESRRLSGADCARATALQREFRAPQVYVYALGQEPWMKYMMGLQYEPDSIQLTESAAFVQQCQAAGLVAERLYGSKEMRF
jgi:L-ascorbate metabolism protein UlaG (beta-lactamase superfamily)